MRTSLQTSCERVQLTLTVCLLVACAANMALVYAWLTPALTRARQSTEHAANRPSRREAAGGCRDGDGMIETLQRGSTRIEALVRRGRFLTTSFLLEVGATAWLI